MKNTKIIFMGVIGAALAISGANAITLAEKEYVDSAYATGKTYAAGVAAAAETNAKSYADSNFATSTALTNGLATKQDTLPTTTGNQNKVLGVTDEYGTLGWIDQSETDTSDKADLQESATSGNVAVFDNKGQYVDSSTALTDLATDSEVSSAINTALSSVTCTSEKVFVGSGSGFTCADTSGQTFTDSSDQQS